jgi:nitroreductase
MDTIGYCSNWSVIFRISFGLFTARVTSSDSLKGDKINVSEAVASRRSVRAFLDTPVDPAVLRRVLARAQRSPSGSNVQPWHGVVVTGEPFARLKAVVAEAFPLGRAGHSIPFNMHPPEIDGVFKSRLFGVGEALYAALGIAREDKPARLQQYARNFEAFGAPVLMLVHTPRYMGPPQWADLGMWLQTVMLLLREEGLDSCPQLSWADYTDQVRQCVAIPDDHVFYCGMAIGTRDPDAAVNNFEVPRAALDDVVRFEGL